MANKSFTVVFIIFFIFTTLLTKSAHSFELSKEDRAFLEKIEQDTFQYFVRMSNKDSGLTKDSTQPGSPSSIAATGFSLAAFAIAHHHNWIDRDYAYKYLLKTLKTLGSKAEHERGFFYHFLNVKTGKRVWGSEASSIDTALLIAGALVAAQYFPGTEIERLANVLYERVDWNWMLNGSDLICMGWKPESGFLPYYWDSYNELIILQALALGSPTYPTPPETWNAWFRREDEFNGKTIVHTHNGSLFTYQYSHAFIDFKNLDDRGINYFTNSIKATIANWEFSSLHRIDHKGYSKYSWGLSASLGPGGYKAYGAKPGQVVHDGTIAPYAPIGSIVFTPKESIEAIRFFYSEYRDKLYGNFGFKGAFNLDMGWFAEEYIGIDQGITILMLENFLNDGIIWKKFMELDFIKSWVQVAELDKGNAQDKLVTSAN